MTLLTQLPVLLRLRQSLKQRPQIVRVVRAIRAIWWLGPWRKFFIKYHQQRNQNPALMRNPNTMFAELDAKKALGNLRQEGYASGLQVPEAAVKQIVNFCGQQNACANPHLHCQTVHDIAHDPKLLAVVKDYFGVEPVLYSSNLYWTWPPNNEQAFQQALARKSKFHYDVGDFSTLIVFIYLTDVDENGGPHIVIRGTHRQKKPKQLLSRYLNDREAVAEFGAQIITITGRRGTGFFEDLTCYHKHSVGTKARLMLTICYLLQRKPLT
ncbi:MAG: hypothetical protein JST85_23570 [Acidobacteria bacterium]|nr:hypothetical protein [Acidobacteriota bacterium]